MNPPKFIDQIRTVIRLWFGSKASNTRGDLQGNTQTPQTSRDGNMRFPKRSDVGARRQSRKWDITLPGKYAGKP